jgi:hypothetical protein
VSLAEKTRHFLRFHAQICEEEKEAVKDDDEPTLEPWDALLGCYQISAKYPHVHSPPKRS